jgi:hypothetical protein
VQKRTRVSFIVQTSSYSSLSVPLGDLDHLKTLQRSLVNLSRSEIDKASPLLLQSFDFSTLYTKIDLVDLKTCMRVLINKVFNWMLKLHRFKFLLVQKAALSFRFLWL